MINKLQYNEEIRKRRVRKMIRARKDEILDQRHCPMLWNITLKEEMVFCMLAHHFSFDPLITKILRNFFPKSEVKDLLLSSRYLFITKKVFPGYYSDRERLIVMLNRYRATHDIEDFIKWLPFHEDDSTAYLVHLMVGMFFLDQYLRHLHQPAWLETSLEHLQKAREGFEEPRCELAFKSLLAFGYYMNHDFHNSLNCLDQRGVNHFQTKFGELLLKVS